MPKFVPRLLVDPRLPTTMPNVAMIDPNKKLAMTLGNLLSSSKYVAQFDV